MNKENNKRTIKADDRYHEILVMINRADGNFVLSNNQLAEQFNVSKETIRKIFNRYRKEGLIEYEMIRVHDQLPCTYIRRTWLTDEGREYL